MPQDGLNISKSTTDNVPREKLVIVALSPLQACSRKVGFQDIQRGRHIASPFQRVRDGVLVYYLSPDVLIIRNHQSYFLLASSQFRRRAGRLQARSKPLSNADN